MALPILSDEQRKAALEKAAVARHARAQLRDDIKSGAKSVESVLSVTISSPAPSPSRASSPLTTPSPSA